MESDSINSLSDLVRPRNVSSSVWEYFGLRTSNGVVIDRFCAICRLCGTSLRSHGSTSSLINHLAAKHEKEYAALNLKKKTARRKTDVLCKDMLFDVPVKKLKIDNAMVGLSSIDSPFLPPDQPIFKEEPFFNDDLIVGEIKSPSVNNSSENSHESRQEQFADSTATSSSCLNLPVESKSKEVDDRRQLDLLDKLGQAMVMNMLPIEFINEPSVRQLFHTLDPSFSIPDEVTFTNLYVDKRFSDIQNCIHQELNSCNKLALTLDHWKTAHEESYCAVHLHAVDSCWNQITRMLKVVLVDCECLPTDILQMLQKVSEEWKINDRNILSITSNGKSVVNDGVRLWNKVNIPCIAGAIHECVKTLILEDTTIYPIINKCRNIGKMLCHSGSLSSASSWRFVDKEKLHNIFVSDSFINWHTSYELLQFVDKHLLYINEIISSHRSTLKINVIEERIVKDVLRVLNPLSEMVNALLSENFVSSSVIKAFLFLIKRKLTTNESDSAFVFNLKKLIVDHLFEVYSTDPQVVDHLLICSLLDPRFKELKFLDTDEKVTAHSLLRNELKKIRLSHSPNNSKVEDDNAHESPSSFSRLFADACDEKRAMSSSDCRGVSYSELLSYLNKEAAANLDSDPLEWWHTRLKLYPILSRLARGFLSCPALSDRRDEQYSIKRLDIVLDTNLSQKMFFLRRNLRQF